MPRNLIRAGKNNGSKYLNPVILLFLLLVIYVFSARHTGQITLIKAENIFQETVMCLPAPVEHAPQVQELNVHNNKQVITRYFMAYCPGTVLNGVNLSRIQSPASLRESVLISFNNAASSCPVATNIYFSKILTIIHA